MHRSLVRSRRLAAAVACALSLAAAGCGDEEPITPEPEINFVGTWRGQPWQGTASPHWVADSLFVFGSAGDPVSPVVVRASVRYDGPGTYPLAPGAAEVYTLIGGDVVGERHLSIAADDAVLIVREHADGVMAGRIVFTARAANPPAGTAPTEGRFDAQFVEAEVRR